MILPCGGFIGPLGVDEVMIIVDGVTAVILFAILHLQVGQEVVVGRIDSTFLKFEIISHLNLSSNFATIFLSAAEVINF